MLNKTQFVIFVIIFVVSIPFIIILFSDEKSRREHLHNFFKDSINDSNKNESTIENYFKPGVDHNTIYFRIIDENGQISYVHDSGIDPSIVKEKGSFKLNVVKKEYNDGKVQILGLPVKVNYGRQIFNLNNTYKVLPNQVKDEDLYYTIDLKL